MRPLGRFDLDWLVVGSGFGGSVAALRLSQKGHTVRVLECGRRFSAEHAMSHIPPAGADAGTTTSTPQPARSLS